MKLRNIGLLVTAGALSFSCAKFNLDKIKYKVESIEVTITAEYPKKTMPKKATADITPTLKYKGGEKAFKTLPVKGEKADGSGTTLSWTGGTVKYNAKIPYVDGMQE